jgi:LemA protein
VEVVVVAAVVVVLVAVPLLVHNRLVKLRNRVEATWSDLDVQLARRADLIPNLVTVVRGYAAHEREVIDRITAVREQALRRAAPHRTAGSVAAGTGQPQRSGGPDGGVPDRAEVEEQLGRQVEQLIAVAEAYPDLKADERFRALSDELTATENKIAFSRQLYNDTVDAYRTAAQSFPGSLIAGPMGFDPPDFFMPRGSEWARDDAGTVRSEDLR